LLFVDWTFAVGLSLFLIAFVAAIVPLKYWLAKRRGLFEPTTFLAGDDGIEVNSSRISSKVSWHAISKIETAHGRSFLFLAPRLALIVPRRAFSSDVDFHRWNEQVREAQASAKSVTVE
jgi:hypothetical protein